MPSTDRDNPPEVAWSPSSGLYRRTGDRWANVGAAVLAYAEPPADAVRLVPADELEKLRAELARKNELVTEAAKQLNAKDGALTEAYEGWKDTRAELARVRQQRETRTRLERYWRHRALGISLDDDVKPDAATMVRQLAAAELDRIRCEIHDEGALATYTAMDVETRLDAAIAELIATEGGPGSVQLPDDWREQVRDRVGPHDERTVTELIESWSRSAGEARPRGWGDVLPSDSAQRGLARPFKSSPENLNQQGGDSSGGGAPAPHRVIPSRSQADIYQELLHYIWLHVDWRYVSKKCTTEQRELWADAVEAVSNSNHPDEPMQVDRWWREAHTPHEPEGAHAESSDEQREFPWERGDAQQTSEAQQGFRFGDPCPDNLKQVRDREGAIWSRRADDMWLTPSATGWCQLGWGPLTYKHGPLTIASEVVRPLSARPEGTHHDQ